MSGRFPDLRFGLPPWLDRALPPPATRFGEPAERMKLVVELARRNVDEETGGPFAAAVFDLEDGHLVAPGVNLVVPEACSSLHAEVVALSLAQRVRGTWDLAAGGAVHELVASVEPCGMCLGAVHWSGISRLVCGARGEDAAAVGFDEGPKPAIWAEELERRGVRVLRDVERRAVRDVLELYRSRGGPIYNSRRGSG